jgi:hypothetical protein
MSGDPWLTWSDEDVVYLSCLVTESLLQGKPLAVWVFSSQDGGWTWTEPVKQVFPADTDQDHPVIASGHDEQGAAIVYAFGTAASRDIEGVDVAVSRSPSAPFRSRGTYAPDRQMVNLGSGAVLPGGGPVFTYFTMRQPYRLWSVRGSEETGAWTETLLSRRVLPVGFPMLAVDQGRGAYAGRVYSVWVESEDQRDLRVVLSWSGDGGVTWSKPLAVHQDTSRVQRTIPSVVVNHAGVVAVSWQDWRLASRPDCTDAYFAASLDGGVSFLPEVRVSDETACFGTDANGAAARRWRLGGGDYRGMTAESDGAFWVIWPDSRTGLFQIWTARVEVGNMEVGGRP